VKKNGEKFDFIDDFANRQRLDTGDGASESKLLPVYGEKVPPFGRLRSRMRGNLCKRAE
jgi:hypothetical protein